jgi:hypothetical protein
VNIFLLPLAEATGEAFLHKALGLVMVLVYLWAAGQSLSAIGLHGRMVGGAILIGAVGIVLHGYQTNVRATMHIGRT